MVGHTTEAHGHAACIGRPAGVVAVQAACDAQAPAANDWGPVQPDERAGGEGAGSGGQARPCAVRARATNTTYPMLAETDVTISAYDHARRRYVPTKYPGIVVSIDPQSRRQ